MTTPFTPGPWCTGEPFETFPGAGLRFHISQAEGAPYTPHYSDVAQFVAETISSEKLAIQQANARLISAAPELLEASETALSYIEAVCFNTPNPKKRKNYADCASILRSAIAKARGET